MSNRRHYKRGPLIWARDGDSETAAEHPAYLLLNNKEVDDDSIICNNTNDNNNDTVLIEWSTNGAVAQIPRSRIREGLVTRRNKGPQDKPTQEVKIKIEEDSVYNYDTDEDGHKHTQSDQKVTPSPVLSSSAAGVKMEDVYNHDTDDDSELPPSPMMKKRKSKSNSSATGKQNKKKAKKVTETVEGKKCHVAKSIKQKEKPRDMIGLDISHLGEVICTSGNWNDVQQSSFESSEILPLDFVQFNEEKGRYEVEEGSNITEDDVIIQAMVMFALYRMERGWGRGRSWKALSVWSGKPANDADDIFPLENLWKEEIKQTIDNKQLGKNTLGHFDNFDNFPRFFGDSCKGRWSRRSSSYIGQVHIFAEQASVQLALHLHNHISKDYALLASSIIHYAFYNEFDLMSDISFSLEDSARKESECFPKTALDDLCKHAQESKK